LAARVYDALAVVVVGVDPQRPAGDDHPLAGVDARAVPQDEESNKPRLVKALFATGSRRQGAQ
jgi:hypothetical protein